MQSYLWRDCAFLKDIYDRKMRNATTKSGSTNLDKKSSVIDLTDDYGNFESEVAMSQEEINSNVADSKYLIPTKKIKKEHSSTENFVNEELNDIEMEEIESVENIFNELIESSSAPDTLERLSQTSFVKRKAEEVLEAAITFSDKRPKSIFDKPTPVTAKSSSLDANSRHDGASANAYSQEAIIVTDMVISIENGSRRAMGLSKVMQIGKKYTK